MADDFNLIPIENPFAGRSNRLVAPEGYELKPLDTPPVQAEPTAAAAPAEKKSYDADEVPLEFLRNFVPSLASELGDMWEGIKGAATDPVGTAKNLGSFIVSMMDALPGEPDSEARQAFLQHIAEQQGPEAAQQRAEGAKMWDVAKKALSEKYGGWDEIKRTAAERPASLLFDVATVFSAGSLAPGRVGAASGKIASAVDPISVAAKGVTAVGEPLVTGRLGVHSGVGSTPLREAARTGFEGGEAGRNFWRAYKSGVPAEEIVRTAEQGVGNIKQRMQQIYEVRKNDPRYGWSNDPSTLDFAPITQAWKDLVDSYTTKSGKRVVGDDEWRQIQKVGDVVAEWEQNPALRTADDFDGLKRRIAAIYPEGEAPQLRRAVTQMKNAVSREINRQVPGYARAMRDYHQAADSLDELRAAFSLNDKASIQTQMSKLQSVMRNNANTQYGLRTDKLRELETEGGVELRPMLAGSALSSWEPRGLARVGMSTAPETAALWSALGPLGAGIGVGAGVAASSPKVLGGLYHGAGRLAGAPDALARFLPQSARPAPGYFYRPLSQKPRLAYRGLGELQQPEEEEGRRRGGFFRSRTK